MSSIIRCPWCVDDQLYVKYHDEEWGVPVHDDAKLFEFLTLEWAQAGLSWITVLRKRENYCKYFYSWNISKIASIGDTILEEILLDPWVIRNHLKVYSVRKNAKIALEIQKEFWSLDAYFWKYVDHTPLVNHFLKVDNFPTESDISRKISKDLKKRGMSFVGSTIMYAFMQAVGMVDDHTDSCIKKLR